MFKVLLIAVLAIPYALLTRHRSTYTEAGVLIGLAAIDVVGLVLYLNLFCVSFEEVVAQEYANSIITVHAVSTGALVAAAAIKAFYATVEHVRRPAR